MGEMWRQLLDSTGTSVRPRVSVLFLDAPEGLRTEFGAQGPVGFTSSAFDAYWLPRALYAQQGLAYSIEHNVLVLCIDYLQRGWPLDWFCTLKGPKVLYVYNCHQQTWDPKAEFVQQFLRVVCLEAGSALAFDPDWSLLVLGEAGVGPKHPHDVVTRIVVPSGWDSPEKILATNESFELGPWREIRLPEVKVAVDLPQPSQEVPLSFALVAEKIRARSTSGHSSPAVRGDAAQGGSAQTHRSGLNSGTPTPTPTPPSTHTSPSAPTPTHELGTHKRQEKRQELGNVLEGLLQKAKR